MSSRTLNSKRNILFGVISKVTSILLPFVVRTAILYILGSQYVGLSSLFTSILQVLNLSELGFSTAVTFSMQKPITQGDDASVSALLRYLRKIYVVIGVLILVVGGAFTPFLSFFIKGSYPENANIYILYLLYLFNVSISYLLFAYKNSLIKALQRFDITSLVHTLVIVARYLVELIILILTKNVYLYACVAIVATIINNIIIDWISKKKFPQYVCKGFVALDERKVIRKQILGLALEKIGDTARNSFDNIIISTLFGLTMVAIYSNYYFVFSAIYGTLLIIINAIQSSVTNSIITNSKTKNYSDMLKFQLIYSFAVGFCTICLICLYQPFMTLWAGKNLLLPFFDVMLFCTYFYIINMNNVRNLYFAGNGLWWKAKVFFICEAIANLVANIVFGLLIGFSGIIIATIITTFAFNFVPRTNILFREYFKQSPRQFYLYHAIYLIFTFVSCAICFFVCSFVKSGGFYGLFSRLFVCSLYGFLLLTILFSFLKPFKEAKEFAVKSILIRK